MKGKTGRKNVKTYTEDILEDFLPEQGLYLWDVEFGKEGPDRFLRVYITKSGEGYIGTDDCEKVSNYLSEKLDEDSPIDGAYFLEVSSAGLERTLKKKDHYRMSLGKRLEVKTYKPIEAKKIFMGTLESLGDDSFTIKSDDSDSLIEIPFNNAAKVNLLADFV
jgi:ribosome maturation factor RimP